MLINGGVMHDLEVSAGKERRDKAIRIVKENKVKITKIIIGTATEIASIDDNNCLYIVLILHLLL